MFDTAMGAQPIHYMGHVRMMAAAQPFISGAISKTVNMPEHVTVEEVEQLFVESWKLGLKAVAIYRDNCKVGSRHVGRQEEERRGRRAGRARDAGAQAPAPEPPIDHDEVRGRRCRGLHHRQLVPRRRDRRDLPEVLEAGLDALAGITDAFSIAVSIGLQYGVPLETYVSKFINMKFEPSGMTNDPGRPVRDLARGLRVPPARARPPADRAARGARSGRSTNARRPRRPRRPRSSARRSRRSSPP